MWTQGELAIVKFMAEKVEDKLISVYRATKALRSIVASHRTWESVRSMLYRFRVKLRAQRGHQ